MWVDKVSYIWILDNSIYASNLVKKNLRVSLDRDFTRQRRYQKPYSSYFVSVFAKACTAVTLIFTIWTTLYLIIWNLKFQISFINKLIHQRVIVSAELREEEITWNNSAIQ